MVHVLVEGIEIVSERPREEMGLLWDQRERPTQPVKRSRQRVPARENQPAAGDIVHPEEGGDQRRFARTGPPNDSEL